MWIGQVGSVRLSTRRRATPTNQRTEIAKVVANRRLDELPTSNDGVGISPVRASRLDPTLFSRDEAPPRLVTGRALGHTAAMHNLGVLLRDQGLAAARTWFRAGRW
jgi:hypothetical protein